MNGGNEWTEGLGNAGKTNRGKIFHGTMRAITSGWRKKRKRRERRYERDKNS